MPKLIALYIKSVAIGFLLSGVFVGLMLWADIANLRHLILGSDMGVVAAAMVIVFNGIIFAGVQFGIAVMSLADKDDGPKGGLREFLLPQIDSRIPAPVKATSPRR